MSSAEKKPLSDVEKQLSTDDRDVKDLWQEALKGYQGIVGFSLERKFDNVQSMLDFGTEQMNKFHKFRHDKGKVDRLRTLLASNLDYVEKGANQIIEAASPAFPPAAAIGTALTYILQACRSVSADYDIVIVFFEDMNSFLQRISILESRLPQKRAYQNCLMEVFTSLLNMCGFAHKYIELGRFKKWITNLFQGEDSELGGARALMNKRLGHLQQATEFAILGNSEETLKMTTQLDENQRSHTQMLERFENTMDSINENTENIKNDVAKLLKLFGGQTEESQANNDMVGSASSVKGVQDAKESGDKTLSARAIRYFIPGLGRNIEEESEALRETLLPDFCNWVFSEPSWNDWLAMKEGERPVLAITGQPGIGKSHLAVALYDKLEERAREDETGHTCVVHFYFREEDDVFCSFLSCMVSIVIQIAETSNAACEKLKAQLARDDININNRLWQHLAIFLLKPLFEQNSKFNLFIVLDGLDEMRDLNAFKEFLSMFVTEKRLRMSLVVTSRPERLEDFPKDIRLLQIEATKDKQRQDFKVNIQVAQHTHQEQVEVLEAFAEALSNKTGFSKMMGKVGMTYRYASTTVTDLRIQDWAKLVKIPEVKDSLSDFSAEWWCRVEQDPATFRLGLAKGYLRELYQSLNVEDAMKAWECLQSIMLLIGKGNLLMEQGRLNFPDQFEDVKNCDGTETVFDASKATLGILGLFVEDVTPDEGGHRATAEVLLKTGYLKPAEKTCRTALLCELNDPEWYRASSVMCDILLQAKKNEYAYQLAGAAVSQLYRVEIPGHLKRAVCTTYARVQTELRNFDSALQYYTEAKNSDPDGITPASDLVAELSVFYQKADQAGYIEALKSWTILERITWLASDYATEGEDRVALLCDIAVQTGEKQFVVEFYEQVVAFLDNLDAGTPLRLDIAVVYFEACKDAGKALNTLNEIFDSHDTIFVYPITSVTPGWVFRMALTLMTNVQVELFRQSRDPVYKAERLQSLASLMERPLSLNIPHISPMATISHRIGLSYMYWVMGPKATFEETLRKLFKESFEALSDSIKWNDGTYLWTLAQALALLSRALGNDDTLRRYARIVGSALLSRRTKSQEDDKSAGGKQRASHIPEGDEHGSEGNSPKDEGDLLSDPGYTCGGFCSPARPFRRWGDGSAYLYITFETGMICEECQTEYEAMKRGERTGKVRYFHGIGHDHVKLPVEGWRGVKNGLLRLDGEEPVPFGSFLKKLQTEVIENAWDRLWSGEA
ncbi:hypothetical protein KNSL1_006622 [Colletotrichum chrysophilum]|nr:hypothetical protein KNSL1_006622 [Colletotrichum chrysophilum]